MDCFLFDPRGSRKCSKLSGPLALPDGVAHSLLPTCLGIRATSVVTEADVDIVLACLKPLLAGPDSPAFHQRARLTTHAFLNMLRPDHPVRLQLMPGYAQPSWPWLSIGVVAQRKILKGEDISGCLMLLTEVDALEANSIGFSCTELTNSKGFAATFAVHSTARFINVSPIDTRFCAHFYGQSAHPAKLAKDKKGAQNTRVELVKSSEGWLATLKAVQDILKGQVGSPRLSGRASDTQHRKS
jgi:hypothetical protein